MIEIELSKDYQISSRDSLGSQEKYFKDGIWYKVDRTGNEGTSEFLVSLLLKYSNRSHYVEYKQALINGKRGCYAENFLKDGEQYFTFDRLYRVVYHKDLQRDVFTLSSVKERFRVLVNVMHKISKVDITDYLSDCIALDMLCLNPDRHFKNLGLLYHAGLFSIAPIYDNGQSLGANWAITPPDLEYQEVLETVSTRTISGSPENQFSVVQNKLEINYEEFFKACDVLCRPSRNLDILLRQLERYRRIFENNKVCCRENGISLESF